MCKGEWDIVWVSVCVSVSLAVSGCVSVCLCVCVRGGWFARREVVSWMCLYKVGVCGVYYFRLYLSVSLSAYKEWVRVWLSVGSVCGRGLMCKSFSWTWTTRYVYGELACIKQNRRKIEIITQGTWHMSLVESWYHIHSPIHITSFFVSVSSPVSVSHRVSGFILLCVVWVYECRVGVCVCCYAFMFCPYKYKKNKESSYNKITSFLKSKSRKTLPLKSNEKKSKGNFQDELLTA